MFDQLLSKNRISYSSSGHSGGGKRLVNGSSSLDLRTNKCVLRYVFGVVFLNSVFGHSFWTPFFDLVFGFRFWISFLHIDFRLCC